MKSSSVWLAAIAFLGVLALGYSALSLANQLKHNAVLLADRQSELAARILTTAITRDMRGVQITVLDSAAVKSVRFDSTLDLEEIVARAFARYPYPECFFAWSAEHPRVFLFVRTDRAIPWARPQAPITPYPVETVSNPGVEHLLQQRMSAHTERGRLYSAFELPIGETLYQAVAIAFYHDSAHERLDRVLGFIVNVGWVRDHYFSELITQTAQLAARSPNIDFVLRDERGATVAHGRGPSPYPGFANQQFSPTFFDPALAAVNMPADVALPLWTLTVSAGGDAFVVASIRSSRQAVILIVCGAATLWAGLIVALHASRKNMELEALRWDFVSSMTHELKSPLSTIRAIARRGGTPELPAYHRSRAASNRHPAQSRPPDDSSRPHRNGACAGQCHRQRHSSWIGSGMDPGRRVCRRRRRRDRSGGRRDWNSGRRTGGSTASFRTRPVGERRWNRPRACDHSQDCGRSQSHTPAQEPGRMWNDIDAALSRLAGVTCQEGF